METLVVAAPHHRNQYYGRIKPHASSGRRQFRGINCRTFQYGPGILPIPFKTPSRKPNTPDSPCSSANTPSYFTESLSKVHCGGTDRRKATAGSSPIPISVKEPRKLCTLSDDIMLTPPDEEDSCFSELWAGPAYSNSPPPSSLPIPNFLMKPKRSASLEIPLPDSDIQLDLVSKSAPASPSREECKYNFPAASDMLCTADFATKILRCILNIDRGDNWVAS